MKTLLIVLSCFCTLSLHAQTVETLLGVEKTVAGSALSLRLGFATKRNIAPGVFAQVKPRIGFSETTSDYETFLGSYLQIPIASSEKLLVTFTIQGGFVDYRFLVVTPLAETRIMVRRNLGLVFGLGYRYGYPSATSSLLYRFKQK
jgi:hypothetical protein